MTRSTTPDNAIITCSYSKDSLFKLVSDASYRIAQELRDANGNSNPDQYGWSVDERTDFDEQLKYAVFKVCEAIQRWTPDADRNTDLYSSDGATITFNLQWGPVRMVPDNQVDVAISKYIEAILLAWWWDVKGVTPLAQIWSAQEERRGKGVRSTLFSRNTNQVNYRAY